MKRKIIRVPREGLPAWRPPGEPDTVWHRRARRALYGVLVATYVTLGVGSLLRWVDVTCAKAVMLCYFLLLGLPAVHYGVRPGKRKAWCITAVLLVPLYFFPALVIIIPLVMLAVQMRGSARSEGRGSSCRTEDERHRRSRRRS